MGASVSRPGGERGMVGREEPRAGIASLVVGAHGGGAGAACSAAIGRIAQAYPFGGRDPVAALKGLAALLMRPPKKKKRERGRDENGLPLWWLFRQPHDEEEEIENEGPALQRVKWWLLEPYCWTEPEPG